MTDRLPGPNNREPYDPDWTRRERRIIEGILTTVTDDGSEYFYILHVMVKDQVWERVRLYFTFLGNLKLWKYYRIITRPARDPDDPPIAEFMMQIGEEVV